MQVSFPYAVEFRRYGHKIYQCVQNLKHALIQGLTAPNRIHALMFAVSNGAGSISAKGRVQEISTHKFIHVHQNYKTWLTSQAYKLQI